MVFYPNAPAVGDVPPDTTPTGVLEPRDFTVTISADGATLYLEFASDDQMVLSPKGLVIPMRIYYIDGNKVSPDQIAFPEGFESAKQFQSVFVVEVTVGRAGPTIPLAQATFPHGGWFWGLAVNPGAQQDALDPSTGPVRIPERNNQTTVPSFQVGSQSVTDTSKVINGVTYRQLLFNWTNPNDVTSGEPLAYVAIFMYNYRGLGKFEFLARISAAAVGGASVGMSQSGVNGVNKGRGEVYVVPDFDGAHNVTFYFAVENASRQHATNYYAVSSWYILWGGI